MKIFAHRGYHNEDHPENTLAAFQRAVDFGVDGIETDLRASADGDTFLFHDRCLPDGTPVSSLTRAELSARVGYDVPTLAEAMSQSWDVEWDLEIKNPEALRAAVPVLRSLVGYVRMFVSSFAHLVVRDAVEALDVEGGLLIYHSPLEPTNLGLGSTRIPYLIWDIETITEQVVAWGAGQGFRNMVYGPITEEEHRRARGLGLEAVITDRPEWG